MLNIFRNTSDNSILQVWLTIQGSVATYLRCGTIVSNYIKKALLVSLTGEKVQIGEYLTKLLARRWLSRALCAPCHTLSCWKWRIHETSRYQKQLLSGCIAWTKLKDAASCYRCSVVRLSVCVSVSHDYELCENVWTDRDAVCVVDTSGPQMHMGWVHPWIELGWVEFGFWFRDAVTGSVHWLREMRTACYTLHFIPKTLNWQNKFNQNYCILKHFIYCLLL